MKMIYDKRNIFESLDDWAKLKKDIYFYRRVPYFKEREVWWASIGFNIGDEENGKNQAYERPVLIIKRFYKNLFLALPITSKSKDGSYYFKIKGEKINGDIILSQGRIIDSKRLLRKVETMNAELFSKVVQKYKNLL